MTILLLLPKVYNRSCFLSLAMFTKPFPFSIVECIASITVWKDKVLNLTHHNYMLHTFSASLPYIEVSFMILLWKMEENIATIALS